MQVRSLLVCALLVGSACDRGEPEPPPYEAPTAASFAFASGIARVESAADTLDVRVEIAEREDQRTYGLMERTSLAEDAGMIFVYDDVQSGDAGFWMYRTRIPLDIAFFDSSGRIVAIRQMEPCTSYDRVVCTAAARDYNPGKPYVGALEVNRGWFARHNVQVGDRITLLRD